MRLHARWLRLLSYLCWLSVTHGAIAQPVNSAVYEAARKKPVGGAPFSIKIKNGLNSLASATATADHESGSIIEVRGPIVVSNSTSASNAADSLLRFNKAVFGLGTNLGDLRAVRESQTLLGKRVVYARYYAGLPVWGEQVQMDFNVSNHLSRMYKSITPFSGTIASVPVLTDEKKGNVITAAIAATKEANAGLVVSGDPTVEQGVILAKDRPMVVCRVRFKSQKPAGSWEVKVDTNTSKVIGKPRNIAQYASAKGHALVYDPNPIQSTGNSGLQRSASFSNVLNAARVPVEVKRLDGSGFLKGDYARISSSTRNTKLEFVFGYDDPRLPEVMAYHWITEAELYLQSLGFTNINDRPIRVNAHCTDEDMSYYDPGDRSLNFGSGGIPDAEDAEVILHELGHAILDDQVPGFANTEDESEAKALGEGFGDYWAESFFSSVGPTNWNVFFDKWDGIPYHGSEHGDPPYLRRLDNTNNFPRPWAGEVHENGQIWSACLWSIRQRVGRTRADKTILQSHYELAAGTATYSDAADAILAVNKALYGGSEGQALVAIFDRFGIGHH